MSTNRSESAIYTVEITLMTEDGELPTSEQVEEMIAAQMSGELDPVTGLFTAAVILRETKT